MLAIFQQRIDDKARQVYHATTGLSFGISLDKLTPARKAQKWSQEDLAEALRVDVRTVQRMEK